jgi:hypothetical protein
MLGVHETGARNISLGLLWAVGAECEECQKSKRGFRAFYWKDNKSEIGEEVMVHFRVSKVSAPERG